MKMLKVLLVEDSPEYSSLVLHWLSGNPSQTEFSLVWTDTLAAALARLDTGDIDVILMDLGLPDSNGIESFTALRLKQEDVPILVLSAGDSEALALETIQLGAEDYLVKSTCTREVLVRTLRHAVARHQLGPTRAHPRDSSNPARVIGIIGSAGGVGATTVACALAADLCHITDQSTLLIDLDSNPGLVGFSMGFDPPYTLQDLLENSQRLDRSLWEEVVTRGPGRLDVIASAKTVAAIDPDIEGLLRVVNFAAKHYRWIVMDLGRLNRTSKQLLTVATDLLLVSAENISALHQCKHAIGMIHDLGFERDKVRLILNHIREVGQVPRNELASLFGIPIVAVLPPAKDDLYDAFMKKRLPRLSDRFHIALDEVARKVAGLPALQSRPIILMITSQTANFDSFSRAVTESGFKWDSRRAGDLPLALARVAGGGVNLVLFDLSGWRTDSDKLNNLAKFAVTVPCLPFVLWSDSDDIGLPAIATQAGAAGYLLGANIVHELKRIITQAVQTETSAPSAVAGESPTRGAAIDFSGMGVSRGLAPPSSR
jgi:Flp pilus assembly CpaE family ATPase